MDSPGVKMKKKISQTIKIEHSSQDSKQQQFLNINYPPGGVGWGQREWRQKMK